MEFLTGAILSGIVYDMIKLSVAITADDLKQQLRGWIIDDVTAIQLATSIKQIENLEDMSEAAISRKLQSIPEMEALLSSIKPVQNYTQINQTHNGTGDNIGGNKIINKD